MPSVAHWLWNHIADKMPMVALLSASYSDVNRLERFGIRGQPPDAAPSTDNSEPKRD